MESLWIKLDEMGIKPQNIENHSEKINVGLEVIEGHREFGNKASS